MLRKLNQIKAHTAELEYGFSSNTYIVTVRNFCLLRNKEMIEWKVIMFIYSLT